MIAQEHPMQMPWLPDGSLPVAGPAPLTCGCGGGSDRRADGAEITAREEDQKIPRLRSCVQADRSAVWLLADELLWPVGLIAVAELERKFKRGRTNI